MLLDKPPIVALSIYSEMKYPTLMSAELLLVRLSL